MTVSRLIFPALRWRDDTGFDHEWESIREALALGVGGFIIFGGTAEAVRALTDAAAARGGPAPPPRRRPGARRGPAIRRAHAVSAAACTYRARSPRGDPLGRRGHGARGAQRGHQLGLRAGCGSRPPARQPDHPDPCLCRRPGARGAPRCRMDRGMPGRRRARVRQALSRSCPHHRGLAHHAASGFRVARTAGGGPGAVPRGDGGRRRLAHDGARELSGARSIGSPGHTVERDHRRAARRVASTDSWSAMR